MFFELDIVICECVCLGGVCLIVESKRREICNKTETVTQIAVIIIIIAIKVINVQTLIVSHTTKGKNVK